MLLVGVVLAEVRGVRVGDILWEKERAGTTEVLEEGCSPALWNSGHCFLIARSSAFL